MTPGGYYHESMKALQTLRAFGRITEMGPELFAVAQERQAKCGPVHVELSIKAPEGGTVSHASIRILSNGQCVSVEHFKNRFDVALEKFLKYGCKPVE